MEEWSFDHDNNILKLYENNKIDIKKGINNHLMIGNSIHDDIIAFNNYDNISNTEYFETIVRLGQKKKLKYTDVPDIFNYSSCYFPIYPSISTQLSFWSSREIKPYLEKIPILYDKYKNIQPNCRCIVERLISTNFCSNTVQKFDEKYCAGHSNIHTQNSYNKYGNLQVPDDKWPGPQYSLLTLKEFNNANTGFNKLLYGNPGKIRNCTKHIIELKDSLSKLEYKKGCICEQERMSRTYLKQCKYCACSIDKVIIMNKALMYNTVFKMYNESKISIDVDENSDIENEINSIIQTNKVWLDSLVMTHFKQNFTVLKDFNSLYDIYFKNKNPQNYIKTIREERAYMAECNCISDKKLREASPLQSSRYIENDKDYDDTESVDEERPGWDELTNFEKKEILDVELDEYWDDYAYTLVDYDYTKVLYTVLLMSLMLNSLFIFMI
tara:strand:+ start:2307 stop:3626 length:1320 start_codon:yes stop_codon:yes gene_type:complete